MDSLLSNFSILPARLITYYLVSDEISNVCSKIEGYISVYQRQIFDTPMDERVKIESLRRKIGSFIGMRELVMDHALITAEMKS